MSLTKVLVSILTCTLIAASAAYADVYQRTVDFEWEPILDAKTYELELTKANATAEKPRLYNTDSAAWSGKLPPAIYSMRIRSKDRRGVPGIWSAPEEFKVTLDPVHTVTPKALEKINSPDGAEHKTTFRWLAVGGAEKYLFTLKSEDGQTKVEETLTATQHTLAIPVAKNYTWSVKAIGAGSESETHSSVNFTVIGKKLTAPKIEKPENIFVRKLQWSASENASAYAFSLRRMDPKTKQWESISLEQNYSSNRLPFNSKWPGGKYRLALKAKANLRPSSEKTEIEFLVNEGSRSPATEEVATTRESIDRFSGWYSIASYLVTLVHYKGQNPDKNSGLDYSAVGGTGRLGGGYLSKESAWGFIGIADLGGITIEGAKTYVFASMETNAIYRTTLGTRGELRQHFGVFMKELPETIGSTSDNITESNTISTAGPHYGIEYWHAITPKLGFQMNAHIYPSMMTIKTPNGQPSQNSMSNQFGILGSYRIRRNVTGLAGYAFRHDEAIYKTNAGNANSAASEGDRNTIQLEGHYLNLFLEWAL